MDLISVSFGPKNEKQLKGPNETEIKSIYSLKSFQKNKKYIS